MVSKVLAIKSMSVLIKQLQPLLPSCCRDQQTQDFVYRNLYLAESFFKHLKKREREKRERREENSFIYFSFLLPLCHISNMCE